ncbi:MAG: hypothetical protein ACKN99_02295, partial [Gemmatimonadota bacterium]
MLVLGPLALLLVLLVRPGAVQANSYTMPYWTNGSGNLECGPQPCPPCQTVSIYDMNDTNLLSGGWRLPITIATGPLRLGSMDLGILYRSEIEGESQLGNQWIPSWEYTVQKTVVNSGSPESNGGHYATVNYPCGFVGIFDWNGSVYVARSCGVTDTLGRPTGVTGPYQLTTKLGDEINFTLGGLPASREDSHGNTITYTYNTTTTQVQSITDDRGFTYTFGHDASGWVDELEDPAGNVWTFDHDAAGNLTAMTTPGTAQQPGGITYEFTYDAYNRLISYKDGRGNTVKTITYIGATYQVDAISMDGDTVDYAYTTGRTDRTDRLGRVFRTHYTGNKITQTDMWISSAAAFVHTYTYGGDDYLAYEVFPRGNRIDYDWDANGNLLERRHKTSNTGSTNSSDIVHTWTYSSNRVATYTDPLGNVTEYTRNGAGDVTLVEFPDVTSPSSQTASRSYTYNGSGQLTQATDEEGKVTAYTYFTTGDDIHLLEKIEVDPSGLDLETVIGYDANWGVDAVTQPGGQTTTYVNDALRRRIQEIAPSTLSWVKYEYDGDGRVTKKQVQNRDKDNAVVSANEWFDTTYTYTTLGDLASITEEISASVTRTTSFDYDDEQQRIRVTLPEGNKVKTEYNERGLVKKVIRGETSGVASDREYFYDDNGNLIEEEN